MHRLLRASLPAVILVSAQLGLAGCSIEVNKDEQGHKADVDVKTPAANVSVKAGIDTPDTGLAVYPGATPSREHDGKEAADVNVSVPFVNVHVIAAKYDSEDAPEKVLAFYRGEMKKFGETLECDGADIDFKNDRMTCRHRRSKGDETTLGVGTERRHRIVAVKPRGSGSELSLVSVETGASS